MTKGFGMDNKYTWESFMNKLDNEIQWEWRWIKLNQKFSHGINWTAWISRFLLLASAVYQIKLGKTETWVVSGIAVLSMLNVALPLLSVTFKFQQRLELHDRNAREYTAIKIKLLAKTITLDTDIEEFTNIYKQSPEDIIHRTP
ncbi:MAG: hypothetical protein HY769_04865 [Candidatus Stahlbacteria bacterium]|nr:hypothetical protein [Candidatus Stahlbacteria bacterium]